MNEYKKIASTKLMSGYPPSKKNDNSMGDLINWEWIIYCANTYDKDIVIVTKDTDFGQENSKQFYLNEWLNHDFNKRTKKKYIIN